MTDALHARRGDQLTRGSELVAQHLPARLADASSWTAAQGVVAWVEGAELVVSAIDGRASRRLRFANDAGAIAALPGFVAFVDGAPHCEAPNAPSCPWGDDVVVASVSDGKQQYPLDWKVRDVARIAVHGRRLLVAHDFRGIEPRLTIVDLRTSPATTRDVGHPAHTPTAIAHDDDAAFAAIEGEIVRFDFATATTTTLRAPRPGTIVTTLHANDGRVLAIDDAGDHDALVVLDAHTGRELRSVTPGTRVNAAFVDRDRVSWCERYDVRSEPLP